ncbi:hypothetical protein GARC_2690 [Paraglaciecola arctica BSs20135]|uniref:Uncharacterized protein n=1 Tax=Paraglaciecola arctica BSs20135 TaxID=493475 RepID=K6Y6Q9_9ALTE|nr:hypothetical protein GARC_2690 [Paraglaciecola arctica BSs20135]
MSDSDISICEGSSNLIYRGRRKMVADSNIEFNYVKGDCSKLFSDFNLSLGYE